MQSAALHLRRGLRANGTYAEAGEGEVAGHQWRFLQAWAGARGLILPAAFTPEREGGREHDVRFDPTLDRWLKFTKPNMAGYAVELVGEHIEMLPATPLQYLHRWRVSNALFGEDVELLGLSETPRGWRLVVLQANARGEDASWEEIDQTMIAGYGLRRLPDTESPGGYEARAYFAGRVGVFDVRPANCVRTAAGVVLPIDVIPQFFNRNDATVLGRLAGATLHVP